MSLTPSDVHVLLESHAADCTGTKSKRQAVGAVLASSPLQGQLRQEMEAVWGPQRAYLELVNDGQCQTHSLFFSLKPSDLTSLLRNGESFGVRPQKDPKRTP